MRESPNITSESKPDEKSEKVSKYELSIIVFCLLCFVVCVGSKRKKKSKEKKSVYGCMCMYVCMDVCVDVYGCMYMCMYVMHFFFCVFFVLVNATEK